MKNFDIPSCIRKVHDTLAMIRNELLLIQSDWLAKQLISLNSSSIKCMTYESVIIKGNPREHKGMQEDYSIMGHFCHFKP